MKRKVEGAMVAGGPPLVKPGEGGPGGSPRTIARMDSGRCRSCGRAFTAGEITGLGILRTRHAHHGGPTIEFACPTCRTIVLLVPYGGGRYAFPGQPPPPPPTDAERTVPWKRRSEKDPTAEVPAESPPSAPPPVRESARPPPPPPQTSKPPAASAEPPPPPPRQLTTLEAFALLGLSPAASMADVEKAYRERALLCHPDKVAHLDTDFIALADRKFRRLHEARDLLVETLDESRRSSR